MSGTAIYHRWSLMNDRCFNERNTMYPNYGGRGITVCQDWLSFESFYRDMGDPPKGYSLGRIDENKAYCRENCEWVKRRINTVYVEGIPRADWCRKHGLDYNTTKKRFQRGWTPEQIKAT